MRARRAHGRFCWRGASAGTNEGSVERDVGDDRAACGGSNWRSERDASRRAVHEISQAAVRAGIARHQRGADRQSVMARGNVASRRGFCRYNGARSRRPRSGAAGGEGSHRDRVGNRCGVTDGSEPGNGSADSDGSDSGNISRGDEEQHHSGRGEAAADGADNESAAPGKSAGVDCEDCERDCGCCGSSSGSRADDRSVAGSRAGDGE